MVFIFCLYRHVFPVLNRMFVVYFGVLRWCSMMIQFVKPWLLVIPSLHDDSISNVITMFFLFSRDSNTKQVVSAQWIWSLGSRRPEETESHQRWHSHVAFIDWLVVWNTCFLVINMTFHSVGNFITPTDFHSMIFSEGWLNHRPVEFTDTEILRTWDF